ncbi:MAG: S41 family peptidase [Ferruginibacter sp.]
MKPVLLNYFMIFFFMPAFCQEKGQPASLNLDFENIINSRPTGWDVFGNAETYAALDSTVTHRGKFAVYIDNSKGNTGFRAWSYTLPANYAGKKIILKGYIKTENVTDGYAGLWMRIDPSIAFDNMNKNGVQGTTGWTKYEITLDMFPAKTKAIVIGGLLTGKGKMWLDEFSISIDGKDIQEIKPLERNLLPAEKDNFFDKGSGITTISTGKNQIDNLKTLGLIWGFLKYYHPKIARGELNWDYELFRILPTVLSANSRKVRDDIFLSWIQQLGDVKNRRENKIDSSNVKMLPDVDWISNSGFSEPLTAALLSVKNADRSKDHFYIGLKQNVSNPDFKNEKPYNNMLFPDAGFRLLSLYRYWNIIQYFYPYKYLIGQDWKNVLEEFIPKIIQTKNETEYTLTMLELIGSVNDTHANIWGGNRILKHYFGLNYAAVSLKFIEGKAVVTGFYDAGKGKETGLEIGDIITGINNSTINDIVAARLKYAPASNYSTKLRDIAPNLLRTNDSLVLVEFYRNGIKATKTLKTYSTKDINIYSKYLEKDTCFKILEMDIAYINNGSLKKTYLPEIWKSLENKKGLIIDDRNYPSDFVIYNLSNYLLPDKMPFVKFSTGNIQTPGFFQYRKNTTAGSNNHKNNFQGKVVIMVNEETQSSAEFHAMAYRLHPNATIIGSTTAGADGNVSQFFLPGGISTMISGIGVYYPDGGETQRIGIVPDVVVKPTINGIINGEDEVLNAAINIINKPR